MNNNLTLKELSEKFLKEIYNQYQKGKDRVHMEEIGSKFDMKHQSDKIRTITDLLVGRNLIKVIIKFNDGIALVSLTPEAIMRIEENGEFNVNVRENQINTVNYNAPIYNSQINTNSQHNVQINNTTDIDNLLNKMIEIIKINREIDESIRKDLLLDINIIKHEVTKSKPDKNWLITKVELLSKFSFLFQYIPGLVECIKNIKL